MADSRHFENQYITITQWKIIRFSWNFVHSSRFWTGWTSRDQKWKSCIGQTPSSTERSSCLFTIRFCWFYSNAPTNTEIKNNVKTKILLSSRYYCMSQYSNSTSGAACRHYEVATDRGPVVHTDTTRGSAAVLSAVKMKMKRDGDVGWWCWIDEDAANDDRYRHNSEQIRVDTEPHSTQSPPCQIATLPVTMCWLFFLVFDVLLSHHIKIDLIWLGLTVETVKLVRERTMDLKSGAQWNTVYFTGQAVAWSAMMRYIIL